jgi:hypothetical protein
MRRGFTAGPFELFTERVLSSTQRVEMSNGSQAAQQVRNGHYSTLHAFFLAAKESGCTEFELQLVMSPKGRIEFCICPRGHSEISAKFDVRGNTVRVAVSDVSIVPVDDADVRLNYGVTEGPKGESTTRTRCSLLSRARASHLKASPQPPPNFTTPRLTSKRSCTGTERGNQTLACGGGL